MTDANRLDDDDMLRMRDDLRAYLGGIVRITGDVLNNAQLIAMRGLGCTEADMRDSELMMIAALVRSVAGEVRTDRLNVAAGRARQILASWNLPAGWESMPITALHTVCDPNGAFDEAVRLTLGLADSSIDIGDLTDVNDTMTRYHERYIRRFIVTCPDGAVRHDELGFERRGDAAHWAEWGHACLAVHTITEIPAEAAT